MAMKRKVRARSAVITVDLCAVRSDGVGIVEIPTVFVDVDADVAAHLKKHAEGLVEFADVSPPATPRVRTEPAE